MLYEHIMLLCVVDVQVDFSMIGQKNVDVTLTHRHDAFEMNSFCRRIMDKSKCIACL